MVTFIFLTREFYADNVKNTEIEQKPTRPYIRVQIEVDGILFGIPMRSNINHPHVLWTDKANHCGLDFSKAVVLTDPEKQINAVDKPYIRPNEFNALRGKEYQIKVGMKKYIVEYKKARGEPSIPRNQRLLRYSTLQYFDTYL